MESRDEAAPSHRTWKTPMKPAFPTATTAPTTGKKDPMEQNQTNTTHNLIVFSKPSSMSPVSVHDVPVSTRTLDETEW